MSNFSLREQLQALSIDSSANSNESMSKHDKKKKKAPAREEMAKSKPAWLEQAQYGVELLKAHFPDCFKEIKEIKPLKVGIKQDLVKNLSAREDIVIGDKACMVSALAYYVNSITYHKSVVEGIQRIDLAGQPAGVVTTEEASYSAECRKSKLQKKKPVSRAE